MKQLIACLLTLCSFEVAFCQYAKDDEVILIRDEPLLYLESVYRQGQKGEIFTVLQYRSDVSKIFLMSTDSSGKTFALNVPVSAVQLAPKDSNALVLRGFNAFKKANYPEAKRLFDEALRVSPPNKLASDLSSQTAAIVQSGTALVNARAQEAKIRPELERRRRNAEIVDRPNAFDRNDNSNQARSAALQQEVANSEKQLQELIATSETQFAAALEEAKKSVDTLTSAGAFSSALIWNDCLAAVAAQHISNLPFHPAIDAGERARFTSKITAADAALENARLAQLQRKLVAASQSVGIGLTSEPGRHELRMLQSELALSLELQDKTLAEAIALQEKRQFDAAAKLLDQSIEKCADHEGINKLCAKIKETIAVKDRELEKAATQEKAGELDAALAIFETYGLEKESLRIIPLLAKLEEDKGNTIRAYALFERAGMADEMKRLKQLKDEQESAYRTARIAVAESRFDDALAVYEKYKDQPSKNQALLKKAVHLEGQQKFEESLALYRELGAVEELTRLKEFLALRDETLREASAMEAAANLDRALQLYQDANSKEGVQRVGQELAQQAEARKNYATAVEYYEICGRYDDAARLRKSYDLTQVSRARLSAEDVFRKCAPACVTIVNFVQDGIGSGFFVAPGGYVLTNYHVVEGAKQVGVADSTGKFYSAEVIAASETPDLALLKVKIGNHPILKMGDSNRTETGAGVFAIGTPKGLPQSISNGIVSHKDREPDFAKGNRCFQINVAINHGNSGGPLIDEYGQVIGINTFSMNTHGSRLGTVGVGSDIHGINYAIKINEARGLLSKVPR